MPTSTQTLKKEATNAALRYSRGKLRSSAMMSFTLSPSWSGQHHPKSPPVRLERRYTTTTPPDKPSVLRAPHEDQGGTAEVRAGLFCPQPGLARRRRALNGGTR